MKPFISFICIVLCIPVYSQGLRILKGSTDVTGTVVTENIVANSNYETRFSLYNSTNSKKTFKITRILKNKLAPGNEFFFAIGNIHVAPSPDSISIFNYPITMDAYTYMLPDLNGDGFTTAFYTGPVCQENFITYKLCDVDGPADTAMVTIHYSCATTIHEFGPGFISDPYPNPAVREVTIDYSLTTAPENANIIVHDVLGKVVKEAVIENKEGRAFINVAELHTGLYFYTFRIDGKTSKAGKLIINDH